VPHYAATSLWQTEAKQPHAVEFMVCTQCASELGLSCPRTSAPLPSAFTTAAAFCAQVAAGGGAGWMASSAAANGDAEKDLPVALRLRLRANPQV
jgi:hypothetical protein